MKSEELLDNAVDYIYDVVYGQDWICEALLDIPEESKICDETCDNLCKDCIIRFLKYYKKK